MTRARSVLVPFGTRPEVVKLAPVVAALRAAGHRVDVVDTGQHTDPRMGSQLQTALGLTPGHRFALPPDPAERTGALHADAFRALRLFAPDLVLALGDTNTVPAYALAARAAGVPFAHLEAGLRSLNPRFSGGLPLTLAAGADVVSAYLAGVRGAPLPELSFRLGVAMSRYFAETYSSDDGSPVVDPCAPVPVTA